MIKRAGTKEDLEELAKNIPTITSGAEDLEPGVSELTDGHIYLVYE